jgi:hypothetical protein
MPVYKISRLRVVQNGLKENMCNMTILCVISRLTAMLLRGNSRNVNILLPLLLALFFYRA